MMTKVLKNPGYAAVFSFFWPGLGQIYNGQILKGLLFFVAMIFCWFLFFMGLVSFAVRNPPLFSSILVCLPFLIWVLAMRDAYKTAVRINEDF
jgi:TM2 domain-containing membrane protein YozV